MTRQPTRLGNLARSWGTTVGSLLVLAPANDPFNADTPASAKRGEWFAALWREHGFGAGVHLRRIHYRLVSGDPVQKPDGLPYQNTEADWSLLGAASKSARYLGLVPAEAFVDRRNPIPILGSDPEYEVPDPDATIVQWLPELPSLAMSLDVVAPDPVPKVEGYEYDDNDQAYILGVWVEKTTMDEELAPVCGRYGADLVRGAGFLSITAVIDLLQRADTSKKPVRVFYVSDFDPAGDAMPVAVARQLEYWRERYAPGADVKLTPLVLSRQQVSDYRLPRKPIKDSDLRRANFEEQYGEGAVELDALEALHPGELARIVSDALRPYVDPTLRSRMDHTEYEAQTVLDVAWADHATEGLAELEAARVEAEAVAARYAERLAALDDELQADLAPVRERLNAVATALGRAFETLDVDLPERPVAEPAPPSEDDWLFDAGRSYQEQLAAYRRRKPKGAPS